MSPSCQPGNTLCPPAKFSRDTKRDRLLTNRPGCFVHPQIVHPCPKGWRIIPFVNSRPGARLGSTMVTSPSVPPSHISHWLLTLLLPCSLNWELSLQRDKYNPYSHLQGGLAQEGAWVRPPQPHLHPQWQPHSSVHVPTKCL